MTILTAKIAIYNYSVPSGTSGEFSIDDVWTDISLNTELINTSTNISFLNNEITLQSGIYEIKTNVSIQGTSYCQTRLLIQNPPNPDEFLYGNSNFALETSTNLNVGNHIIEVPETETKIIKLQYLYGNPGIHPPCNCDGVDEIYTQVLIKELIVEDDPQPIEFEDIYNEAFFIHSTSADGGSFIANTWQQRELTTPVFNNITDCSLLNNQITLSIGHYIVEASAPAVEVYGHTIRLINSNTQEVLAEGNSQFSWDQDDDNNRSFLFGYLELLEETTIEIQHYGNNDVPVIGLGKSLITSSVNIYTTIKITQTKKQLIP